MANGLWGLFGMFSHFYKDFTDLSAKLSLSSDVG